MSNSKSIPELNFVAVCTKAMKWETGSKVETLTNFGCQYLKLNIYTTTPHLYKKNQLSFLKNNNKMNEV